MSQPIIPLSQEQLQLLIEAVRSAVIPATQPESSNTPKSSLSNCKHRFAGARNHDVVEEFVSAVATYKDVEHISDEDALRGISLLFEGFASTWWQGVRKEAKTWNDAIALIRNHFAPTKQPYQLYLEIFETKQDDYTSIDEFVPTKRALLAQLPENRHDEQTELDLIYGLLHIKYRKHITRLDVTSFKELLNKGRQIETNYDEDSQLKTRQTKYVKRCSHCNFRGHTVDQCRKRKTVDAVVDDA